MLDIGINNFYQIKQSFKIGRDLLRVNLIHRSRAITEINFQTKLLF